MRDINRIRPLLDKLETLWKQYPDMRFGQLIYMLAHRHNVNDIFFPEDDKWEEIIIQMIEESNNRMNHENQTQCTCCKKYVDNDRIWFHRNGWKHICFDCY